MLSVTSWCEVAKEFGIWGQVEELLAQGIAPVIELPKAVKVIETIKRPVGRPRLVPKGEKHRKHGAMQSTSGNQLKCRAKGCNKYISRYKEDSVCCDQCREALIEYCQVTLDVLEGRMRARDYPPQYRPAKLRLVKSKKDENRGLDKEADRRARYTAVR